jgi:phage baseplate assembly protein W
VSGPPGGFHVAFPLAHDGRGQTGLADEERYLTGLIEQVLFTRPGERVNRPDFGSGVDSLVFAPSGDELAQTTRALVHGALQRFLGELLRVEEVHVVATESTIEVTVAYLPLPAVSGDARRVVQVSGGVAART